MRLRTLLQRAGLKVSIFEKFQPHVTLKTLPTAEVQARASELMGPLTALRAIDFEVYEVMLHWGKDRASRAFAL